MLGCVSVIPVNGSLAETLHVPLNIVNKVLVDMMYVSLVTLQCLTMS